MLVVGNGAVVCPEKVVMQGAVYIEDNKIVEIGTTDELQERHSNAYFVDAKGGIIMPGLTNIHTHLYSTFARGMSLPGKPASNFVEILNNLWWRLDKALTAEDIYYSALVPLIDCVKFGTTTMIDHHASPAFVTGSLEKIQEALNKIPIRTALCYEVSDRDGLDVAEKGIEENTQFIERFRGGDMLTAMFGLHASFTVSNETLTKCLEQVFKLGCGFHLHAAEGRADVEDSKKKYKMGVVERLNKYNVLGPKTLLAHCIHITEEEMDILAKTRTNVAHNPESNMNNAVGAANTQKMLEKGVLVGLGTDGMTMDMFQEAKFAHLLRKHVGADPRIGFVEAGKMLFENNYRILSNFFSAPLGRIELGAFADIIVLNYISPTPINRGNFLGHFLYGMSSNDVDTTIVNGRVLMENGELKGIDEDEIMFHSRRLAGELWKRI